VCPFGSPAGRIRDHSDGDGDDWEDEAFDEDVSDDHELELRSSQGT